MNNDFDISRIIFAIRRNLRLFISIILFFLALVIIYIFLSTKKYTAQATIFIDPTQAYTTSNIDPVSQNSDFTAAFLDSQASIITSRKVALRAIKKLYPNASKDEIEEAYGEIIKKLSVSREGESYVLKVSFTHPDNQFVAKVVNSFVKEYIAEQSTVRFENSKIGADWLSDRIKDLSKKSFEANKDLQNFKTRHNIIASTSDRLINQDQLVQINDQLGVARAETATLKARYEHSKKIIDNRDVNAAVAQALDNDVINGVRINYLDRKKRYASLLRELGGAHDVVLGLEKEIAEYETIIFNEMRRIMQSQFSEYEVSKAREITLEQSLGGLVEVRNKSDSVKSELLHLEEQAKTYNDLLTSYIQKFEALNQSQTFALSDTRVISQAITPKKASNPNKILLIGLALILGSAIAFIVILYLEVNDKSFRSASQLVSKLGLASLGIFPTKEVGLRNDVNKFTTSRQKFKFKNPINTVAVDDQLSLYSETLRRVKNSIDEALTDKSCKIVGITSVVADEGKSTIALNLATYLAKSGAKTLYLDMDIRKPVFGYENFNEPIVGLGDFFNNDNISVSDLIIHEGTNLHLLPAIGKDPEKLQQIISKEMLSHLIQTLSGRFEYIITDFPPLEITADINVASTIIDSFLFVTHWNKTNSDYIKELLDRTPLLKSKILGVILNKVDMKMFGLLSNQPKYKDYYDL